MIGTYLAEHMADIKRLADGIGLLGVAILAVGLTALIFARHRKRTDQ
jgi:hypothetical protein